MESTVLPSTGILVMYKEEEAQSSDGSKGLFSHVKETIIRVAPLNIEQFSHNLQELCAQLSSVFDKVTPSIGKCDLDSFELSVDVTAKGEVKLIGSVGSELKGGLKLVFKRNKE